MKELEGVILDIQKRVRELPRNTDPKVHELISVFLEVISSYQEWVNELKASILGQDADIQRMKKTIEFLQKKTFERKSEEKKILVPEGFEK